MEHTIRRDITQKTGHEYELVRGDLKEVHDWHVKQTEHRFKCTCGEQFNTEEKAIEHIKENKSNS